MAAPNIVNVTTITGKTAVDADIAATPSTLVENTAASGKVFKVNALYIANIDGTDNADITVELYRSTVSYYITNAVVVPAKATLDILSKAIYLEEGDAIRLTANAAGDLSAVCSYEEIS